MSAINTPISLDQIHTTIPDAPSFALIRLAKCMSCEHATAENRCGLQPTACFISSLVQLEWKTCPENKWDTDLGN